MIGSEHAQHPVSPPLRSTVRPVHYRRPQQHAEPYPQSDLTSSNDRKHLLHRDHIARVGVLLLDRGLQHRTTAVYLYHLESPGGEDRGDEE